MTKSFTRMDKEVKEWNDGALILNPVGLTIVVSHPTHFHTAPPPPSPTIVKVCHLIFSMFFSQVFSVMVWNDVHFHSGITTTNLSPNLFTFILSSLISLSFLFFSNF